MNREEHREYMRKRIAERREERREYQRNRRSEHKEEYREYMRKRRAEHKEDMKKYRAEHRAESNARMKIKKAEDLNSNGIPKKDIRLSSRRILEKCHAKLPDYEIHHCFGYEDPEKFIYIPKSLHIQIHNLLRDKKIPSDSDHWQFIRELVNECEEYTYIRT